METTMNKITSIAITLLIAAATGCSNPCDERITPQEQDVMIEALELASFQGLTYNEVIAGAAAICFDRTCRECFAYLADQSGIRRTTSLPPCPEDLITDGTVDSADLAYLLGEWGDCLPSLTNDECLSDFNNDDVVNNEDMAQLLSVWGPCP